MGLFDKVFGKRKKQEDNIPKPELINTADILFTIPTVSNEFPPITDTSVTVKFDISIFDDDWRQNEFLNFSSLPLIEVEIKGIKNIWDNHSKKFEGKFTAFTKCHVRNTIGEPNLEIKLAQLSEALVKAEIGILKKNGNYVSNSFSLKTTNTDYYGIVNNGLVTQLCISQWNDNTTQEIFTLTKLFNLVFVNWYHCDILRHEDE